MYQSYLTFLPLPSFPYSKRTSSSHFPTPCMKTTTTSSTTSSSSSSSSSSPSLLKTLLSIEQLTRPGTPSNASRFSSLPSISKTSSQMLGRLSPGCEGTRSVFPRCNFACKPCYHSTEANHVRIDGAHTLIEVSRQMNQLYKLRGPVAHCQLIGGEVSLLNAEDHANTLQIMKHFGRIPMSFTHGDFDYDYLKRLAINEYGKNRFDRLDFAVHFDSGMRGRKGILKPNSEKDLHPYRKQFVNMFYKLKKEHNTQFYLAHNMTVTESNLNQVDEVVKNTMGMGFRLLSFQPAAKVGATKRWVSGVNEQKTEDDGQCVWEKLEHGMGIRLPYTLFQMGDVRCNRMCVVGIVGLGNGPQPFHKIHAFPMFDDQCEQDIKARDLVMQYIGNIVLAPPLLFLKVCRTILRRPWLLIPFVGWVLRIIGRAGGVGNIFRNGLQPLTIVMHRFMDAEQVQRAWEMMETGVKSDEQGLDDQVRDTMQRLEACSYGMARPEEARIVPACVQHAVYDPEENRQLAQMLPLTQPAQSTAEVDRNIVMPELGCSGEI